LAPETPPETPAETGLMMDEVRRFRQVQAQQQRRLKRQRWALSTLSYPLLALGLIGLLLLLLPAISRGLAPVLSRVLHDPAPCTIKGEITFLGDRRYFVPGDARYDDVMVTTRRGERWFCSEEEARAAGWLPSN
jgi:hypothetical protein